MTTKPTNPKDAIGAAKLPLHLVPDTLRIYAAMAFAEGASKYGAYNWRAAGAAHRPRAGLQGHGRRQDGQGPQDRRGRGFLPGPVHGMTHQTARVSADGRRAAAMIPSSLGRDARVKPHMHPGGYSPFGQPRKGRVQVRLFR